MRILIWEQKASREGYIHRVLVAIDILVNVIAGGNEDETISSRVRRISDAHPEFSFNPFILLAKLINGGLNLIWRNHGEHAEAADLERAEHEERVEDKALDIRK